MPTYTTATVFQTFSTGSQPGDLAVPQLGGSVTLLSNGSSYLAPNYLLTSGNALIVNGSISFQFPVAVNFFSYVGNVGAGNSVTLNYTDNTSSTLTGLAMAGVADNQYLNTQGRISYDTFGARGISSVTFRSNGSLGLDDVAAAIPESSTWAMIVVGLGILNVALRRCKRPADPQAA